MADWVGLEIKVPGKDFLKPVRQVLETLLIFLEVLKTILNTVKVLLVDFGNPIRVLVEALIKLIEELILSLQATGAFMYLDVPNPLEDPNFDRFHGGFPNFLEKWKGSLLDQQDPNRPQPRSSTQSGFVILVVEATDPFALLERITQLLRFFSKELTKPRYASPAGFRAFPVGSGDDPITALADVFSKGPVEAIELKWELPTTKELPDPGFTDLVARVGADFIPPKWLIERANTPLTEELDVSGSQPGKINLGDLNAPGISGKCVFTCETPFTLPGTLTPATVKQQLLDETGEQVLKFDKVEVLTRQSLEGLLGQLGTFRYIDRDIELGQTYYYRLRAFTGPLNVKNDAIQWPQAAIIHGEQSVPSTSWPADGPSKVIVMGDPSPIVSVIVPDVGDFDVLENLKRLYQAAFSHDFHLPLPEGAKFDNNGDPIDPTEPDDIGKGSLSNQASILSVLRSVGILEEYLAFREVGPVAGTNEPDMPWVLPKVRRMSARLAQVIAQAILGSGVEAATNFQELMTGPLPSQPPPFNNDGKPFENLSSLVFQLTETTEGDKKVATTAAKTLYFDSYSSARVRKNLLYAVSYLNGFAMQGVPPNWISVQPLRDIIPWSAEFLYTLLDKIDSLLAAYSGLIKEISNFIDLLIRKIETLERFIQFLIDILNLIESLQVGAYLLSAPDAGGTASDWWNLVDNAGGIKPSVGPGGYSAGISFAWVAPDVQALATTFKLIFGG